MVVAAGVVVFVSVVVVIGEVPVVSGAVGVTVSGCDVLSPVGMFVVGSTVVRSARKRVVN